MTDSEGYESGMKRTWDDEDCPHDWCDGELQQQDRFNVMCLSCESAWSHIRLPATYNEPEKHCLQGAGGELWAEKPAVATDGGAESENGDPQFVDAEGLLPHGELLRDIRGTGNAIHVGYRSREKYEDRVATEHHWIAHQPDYDDRPEEYVSVRISTSVGQVSYVDFETAVSHLEPPRFYEWEQVVKAVVPTERTPIPYKKESTLSVECPECERFGTTHPWKLDDYLPDECPCGFGGEWDVRA